MRYKFVNMNEKYAYKIQKWEYEGEYAIYNYANSKSLFEPANWNHIYAILDENNDLVGEVTFYMNTSDMFYGQGMRPDLTGKGYGSELIKQALKFGINKYNYQRDRIFLDVLSFNERAIKAYEKCGFRVDSRYSQEYEGVKYDFIRMYYSIIRSGQTMEIIDLSFGMDQYIQQTAELLMESFEHSWSTIQEATIEVKESLGTDRISRIAINNQGHLLGWIGGVRSYDGNVWEMHPLVVNKSCRGQGIGRLLVEDFEIIVAEKGGLTILLGTDDENMSTTIGGIDVYPDLYENIRNIKNIKNHPYEFYLKVGYKIVGVVPDANGYGKPDILMAKRVKE